MTYRKIWILLFITLLGVVFFVENIMSGVCFCEKCRPYIYKNITELKISSAFNRHSINNLNDTCRLSLWNSVKAIRFYKQSLKDKIYCFSIISGLRDFAPSAVAHHVKVETIRSIQNQPIYLKCLSLRC
jgi:hypothetical protein